MTPLCGHLTAFVKDQIGGSTRSLFAHGTPPLRDTLSYPGDPGLLGPDSVSWRVVGDASALVGGVRALIVQTAHPEVVAGVEQHSRYRDDPLGRLSRTAAYVTETTFGAMPEVDAAVAAVRRAHGPVRGRSGRGKAYSATNKAMAAWVHNALTDSFLAAYQAYGPQPLTPAEADRFVAEQTRVGALLGAAPLPTTAATLRKWIATNPALEGSAELEAAMDFLRHPPLAAATRVGYSVLFDAAVATIPAELRQLIGVEPPPCSREVGIAAVAALRWALGPSPVLRLATERSETPGATTPAANLSR